MTKGVHAMERGKGERLHAERRKRFWLAIVGLALIGLIAGFVSGFAEGRGTDLPPWALTVVGGTVILTAILAAYGSWRFFVSVDELEVLDNLWASLIGFFAYVFLFPSWWMLHQLGKAPEPDDWVILQVSLVTTIVAYAVRKWRAR